MKRTLFALALLFGVFANAVAQNWDVVTSSEDYYYGEGQGETYEAAKNMALKALTGMIATHVSNDFTYLIDETNKNGEIEHESRVLNCLNTYSQATLNNVEEWKKHTPPQWIVRCYILRSDMEKVYASRIEKAKMYCNTAEQALEERNLVDALHDYYWAYSLIRSLQKPNDAKDDDGNLLVVTIPKKIEHILNNVEVTFESRNESDRGDRVNLLFTYEGKPVSSLEFSYNNGQDISSGCSVKNGRGAFDVQKMHSGEVYHLNLEFEHKQLAQRDVELAGVLNVVPKAVFRGAEKKVQGRKPGEAPASVAEKANAEIVNALQVNAQVSQLYAHPEEYKAKMDEVIKAIAARRYSDVANYRYFTPYGLKVFNKLVFYGAGSIVGIPNVQFFNGLDSCVVARGLQMSFTFTRGRKQTFVEDVIFYFDREGKIDNVSFGLGIETTNSILERNAASWDNYTREVLLEFLENYRTAYALERLDYIESIFSEDAKIIVGRVLKTKANSTYAERGMNIPRSGQDAIKYTRHTKKTYMEHLRRVFDNNEFININFSNLSLKKITKITDKEMFAIQLFQSYTSSNYSDKGYLFLLVDLTDRNEPLIEIRTWQPDEIDHNALYHEGYFYSH